MDKSSIEQTVLNLLRNGKEGAYWDFKQEWHTEMPDLLKDIICFTNTVHDKDCYIVFGVSDDLIITGMHLQRKKQADIIDAMDKLSFATVHIPQFSVETITINDTEIDVLIINNTDKTPVYLKKPYGKMLAGCIYTRIEDRNTPDGGNADEEQIEFLWKKRFGLTKSVLQFILERLKYKHEWSCKTENEYYNIYRPECVLRVQETKDDERREDAFYCHNQTNESMYFETLQIIASNTVLMTAQLAVLDSGRLGIPVPEFGFIYKDAYKHEHFSYRYYTEGTDIYRLLSFFYDLNNEEQQYAFSQHMAVVLLYRSEHEHIMFESFATSRINDIDQYVNAHKNEVVLFTSNNTKTEVYKENILVGKCLNTMLSEFRKERLME